MNNEHDELPGTINRATFDVLCGVETLGFKGTKFEFAAWVIGKYKESGKHLIEIKDVPRDTRGSIEVLEFVAAHLNVLDLHACSRIEGKQTSNEISWDLLCVPVRIWCPEFSLGVFLEFFQEWLTFAQPINVNR